MWGVLELIVLMTFAALSCERIFKAPACDLCTVETRCVLLFGTSLQGTRHTPHIKRRAFSK
jgi:hypothetical protein